jgi:soluble lytic murein transglycosylase
MFILTSIHKREEGNVMVKKRKKRRTMGKKIFIFLGIAILAVFSILNIPFLEKVIYPYPNRAIIEKYAEQYGVDPLLVVAVIREESKFFSQSESPKGAKGLMQLMPGTAQSIAESLGDKTFNEGDLLKPEKNIQYGTWYLASLQRAFANNTMLVTAAYNGGRGHVQEWINNGQLDRNNIRIQDIPFKETRDYVGRVVKSYAQYK